MAERRTATNVYARPETRILLEYLAKRDTRSITDEVKVVVHEACRARGIDPDKLLVELMGESAAA